MVIVRDGKTLTYELVQGTRAPPSPPVLEELRKLIGVALAEPQAR